MNMNSIKEVKSKLSKTNNKNYDVTAQTNNKFLKGKKIPHSHKQKQRHVKNKPHTSIKIILKIYQILNNLNKQKVIL